MTAMRKRNHRRSFAGFFVRRRLRPRRAAPSARAAIAGAEQAAPWALQPVCRVAEVRPPWGALAEQDRAGVLVPDPAWRRRRLYPSILSPVRAAALARPDGEAAAPRAGGPVPAPEPAAGLVVEAWALAAHLAGSSTILRGPTLCPPVKRSCSEPFQPHGHMQAGKQTL